MGFHGAVAFVDEEPADHTGPSVHVFVVAPCGEVDVPVVQLQGYVADGVGEVPADGYVEGLAVSGYGFHVEELARVELNAWEKNEGGRWGVLGDDGEDVFGGKVGGGCRWWFYGDECGGVEIVVCDLR